MFATDYRPQILNDIIGQKPIVTTLKNYLKDNSLPSVLYFIGQSGSGKNTLSNIIAKTIVCDNPIKEKEGYFSPCNQCPSCLDIIEERFQKSVRVYNGGFLNTEGIKELEENLNYGTLDNKKKVFIINEAQQVKEMRRMLEIIEPNRKDVYFIFTSTDRNKFSNVGGKENKNQEIQATRSRGAFFNIKPVDSSTIMEYLFEFLKKVDPDQKIPDIFIDEGLSTITDNSFGNVRLALNDFNQAIKGEVYDKKSISSLLGYQDEKEYHRLVYNLAIKNREVLKELKEQEDIFGFFVYSWKILTNTAFKFISNDLNKDDWKDKISYDIINSKNLDDLLKVYEYTNEKCHGNFNENSFYNELYFYFNKKLENNLSSPIIERIKGQPIRKVKTKV
jgi:DNA polymerase III subunit gamma/tau